MFLKRIAVFATGVLLVLPAFAQYKDEAQPAEDKVVLTLDDALKIALSENTSVKVADLEIQRQEYARKGSYGSLLPQVSASGMYSYALKKQKVYFGSDKKDEDGEGSGGGGMAGMMAALMNPIMYYIEQLYAGTGVPFVPYVDPGSSQEGGSSSSEPMEMGRSHSVTFGLSAQMPLVNLQLWESLRLSGDQVELAVEQARESRLGTVASVKQAYYAILFAKEAYNVYNSVFENAVENFRLTEMRYNAAKASELDLTRAKANVAAAIPNLYNAENSVELALWQLKAVMGVDLDRNIDVAGSLAEYADQMFSDIAEGNEASLDGNSTLRQLAQQAEMMARQIRMQQYAYLPTLSLTFSYSYLTQSDIFNLSQWKWFPSSTIGVSLSIPIFSGGQRYHAIKQARVQADELDLQRENTERQLRIGIRQSLGTMDTAMRTYDASKEALVSAEKAYDIAVKSYQLGKSTLTDLNNTELVLTQSKLAVSQAIYNFVIAKAGLEQTLGYDFNEN
ncbi:MAG: TolC family protein [Bacteroidales bacterium]|nr:TolC family protein [Bacteroidales bacterium]MBR2226556.1 TolC family protein [Bacteroidales bacterium]MBR3097418.1 TolC family protein [Bacteroidales bacterium]